MSTTIYALSSGSPPAAIGVIRISGPQALEINEYFTGIAHPVFRRASLTRLRDPGNGDILDTVILLPFDGPKTATGEDLVEWHCHGGQAVVRAILAALDRFSASHADLDISAARPGEFTRRAFENGRIDLNEAEGLADLLSAETESQRRSALLMAEGHFSRRIESWREELLQCAAVVESLLDFSDEDDVAEEGAARRISMRLHAIGTDMRAQLAAPSAERLNEGITVVIAGPPNAGKSTLLNALAGRDAAIVSDIAGTTRDRIDVAVNLGGVAFTITDTAGLAHETQDVIERIGIDRAQQAIVSCDLLLWLGEPLVSPRPDAIIVAAKMDRNGWTMPDGATVALSAATGANMQALVDLMLERAQALVPAEGSYALHQRQRDAVTQMAAYVDFAQQETDQLIVAENLRYTLVEMDRLVGRSGIENMLDALFSRFCIGK